MQTEDYITDTDDNEEEKEQSRNNTNSRFKRYLYDPSYHEQSQQQQQQQQHEEEEEEGEEKEKEKEGEQGKKKSFVIRQPIKVTTTTKTTTSNKETTKIKKDKAFASFLDNKVGSNVIRMMRKMGYNFDTGLGKNRNGIINPIKVIPTGKHHAVIVSDDQHHIQNTRTQTDESEVEEIGTSHAKNERIKRWKKNNLANTKPVRKPKVTFKTVEQVLKERETYSSKTSATTSVNNKFEIIDMTGKEARVISSMDQLRTSSLSRIGTLPQSAASRVLPELQYNIHELVNLSEQSIRDVDHKIQEEKNKFLQLDQQRMKLEELIQKQSETIDSLKQVLNIVSKCFERMNSCLPSNSLVNSVHVHHSAATIVNHNQSESIDSINNNNNNNNLPMTLEELYDTFEMLQHKYREIYSKYHIGQCAVALASPLIKSKFENWNPLEQPDLHASTLYKWRQLLSNEYNRRDGLQKEKGWRQQLLDNNNNNNKMVNVKQMAAAAAATTTTVVSIGIKQEGNRLNIDEEEDDMYERMIQDVILPKIRCSLRTEWDPIHDCDAAIRLVEHFVLRLLPETMIKHVIDQLILSKLVDAVENEWRCKKGELLVHTWIHPWLPVLSTNNDNSIVNRMERMGLFPTIRHKVTVALQDMHWTPCLSESDNIWAYELISPWRQVFEQQDYNKWLLGTIVPKLIYALREHLVIDPSNQDLNPFTSVMLWSRNSTVPNQHMISILESEFFPKWNSVLYDWLCQLQQQEQEEEREQYFEQINKWFHGWKSLLPEHISKSRKIQMQFSRAVDMINQALSGQTITPPHSLLPPSVVLREQKKQRRNRVKSTAAATQVHELSFKELIEQFAAQNDLVFLPREGMKVNGKQLYSFAGLSTYMDHDCLYLKDTATQVWKPVTLDEYLKRATEGQ